MSTADAAQREADWLSTSGDGLPALLKTDSGPFAVVQAYWPRTIGQRHTGLYVLRPAMVERRFAEQRKIVSYEFTLKIWWPIGSSTNGAQIWEVEEAALDSAVELVLQRIRGTVSDKTHGGRFLSVAEAPTPGHITVRFDDPERTAAASPAVLRAEITYVADEQLTAI
jgi:hypothetical protein